MRYKDLLGNSVSGVVWSPGAKVNHVWVLRPNGTAALVKVDPKNGHKEVEYTPPRRGVDIPPEVRRMAEGVMRDAEEGRQALKELGAIPIGPEIEAAKYILRAVDQAEKARTPFINARGGNQAVSDKRLIELSKEEP